MRQPLSRLGRTAIVVPGIAMALTLAGCKNDQEGAASKPSNSASQVTGPGSDSAAPVSPSPSPTGHKQSAPKTNLTVTVRMSPSAKPITRTLTCDPVGGTVPHAANACAALDKAAAAKGGDPFAPTPKGQMCTQIFGGPQTATVKGIFNGKKVNATFGRKNGCEVKRWNDIAALFGPLPHTPVH